MKIAKIVTRVLLGLIFLVFGLNGLLQAFGGTGFIPQPEFANPAAGKFIGALFSVGYFGTILKLTEVIVGLLLISGMFVPLALVLISPIVVQILLFHTLLEPAGAPMAIILTLLTAFLGYAHWDSFKPLFLKSAWSE